MALSREMGRQGVYVGQVAFLLLGLQRRMRLYLWVGARRVDLIKECAPWALPFCTEKPMGDATLCRTVVDEDIGLLQVRRIVETAEALAGNHYVACLPCLGHQDDEQP